MLPSHTTVYSDAVVGRSIEETEFKSHETEGRRCQLKLTKMQLEHQMLADNYHKDNGRALKFRLLPFTVSKLHNPVIRLSELTDTLDLIDSLDKKEPYKVCNTSKTFLAVVEKAFLQEKQQDASASATHTMRGSLSITEVCAAVINYSTL